MKGLSTVHNIGIQTFVANSYFTNVIRSNATLKHLRYGTNNCWLEKCRIISFLFVHQTLNILLSIFLSPNLSSSENTAFRWVLSNIQQSQPTLTLLSYFNRKQMVYASWYTFRHHIISNILDSLFGEVLTSLATIFKLEEISFLVSDKYFSLSEHQLL